ncbi:P-loop containing nucleoside triphosphate hydrolase protein, partial [Cyathus striatus]
SILGKTGVGKSTFINALIGQDKMEVGHDMMTCTKTIQHTIMNNPRNANQRLVIVDTPSFDIIDIRDDEILRRFSVWLATSYTAETKIGGVIYLHDISDCSMDATTTRNLEIFQRLCGLDSFHSFILGTTKWDSVKPSVGGLREEELLKNYWNNMINSGSSVYRFKNTGPSAWNMVDKILDGV